MKFLVSSNNLNGIIGVEFNKDTDTSKKECGDYYIKRFFDFKKFEKKQCVFSIHVYNKLLILVKLSGSLSIHSFNNQEKTFCESEDYPEISEVLLSSNSDVPISSHLLESLGLIIVAFKSGDIFFFNLENLSNKPFKLTLPNDKNVEAFSYDENLKGHFCYGGEKNDLKVVKLYDSSLTKEIIKSTSFEMLFKVVLIYSAKNVKNNYLGLESPVWITNLKFFNIESENSFKIITSTKYGEARIYDFSKSRRPISTFKLTKHSIRNLIFSKDDYSEIIITDTNNLLIRYNLIETNRNTSIHSYSLKPKRNFLEKVTGSIISLNVSDNFLITGGLDRYLRVFDLNTLKIVSKIYVGVEITSIKPIDLNESFIIKKDNEC